MLKGNGASQNHIEINAFKKDIFETFCMFPFDVKKDVHRRFEFLPFEERCSLIMMACWLLEEWPGRFFYYCKKHDVWPSTIFSNYKDEMPFWFIDPIISNLSIDLSSRQYARWERRRITTRENTVLHQLV